MFRGLSGDPCSGPPCFLELLFEATPFCSWGTSPSPRPVHKLLSWTLFWANPSPPLSFLSLVPAVPAQMLKNLPAVLETWVRSWGREDPLEKEMATPCSILAWRIPWTEESGWLLSMDGEESDVTERLALSLFTFKPTALLPLPVSPSPTQLPLFSLLLCPPLKVCSPPLPPSRQTVCPRPTTSEALETPSPDYPWGAWSPHQGRGRHQGQRGAKEETGGG